MKRNRWRWGERTHPAWILSNRRPHYEMEQQSTHYFRQTNSVVFSLFEVIFVSNYSKVNGKHG